MEAVKGFNQKKPLIRTAVVSVDISKVFDLVDHKLLLKQLSETDLHSNVVQWLAAYLHDQRASTLYHSCQSLYVKVHSGIPQGSVLYPALFNIFEWDFPALAPILSNFADDFYDEEKSAYLEALSAALNEDLFLIEAWAESKNLKLAPDKSSITLFTPDPHQTNYHPQVFLNGKLVPLAKTPKWLGVVQDLKINSSHQVSDLIPRLTHRVQIMQALADSTIGQSMETLIRTYKAILHPLWNVTVRFGYLMLV
jgi:hypothetical protein